MSELWTADRDFSFSHLKTRNPLIKKQAGVKIFHPLLRFLSFGITLRQPANGRLVQPPMIMPENKDPLRPPAPLSSSPESAELREKLSKLRNAIFQLHKALIDSERITYEQTMGTIPSPGYFLQLLTNDPWFAWLHPFSQLIVALDVAIDSKEPLTAATVDVLVRQTISILTPSETGEGFARHYFDALQRDPDVVFAHVTASRLARAPILPAEKK